MQLPLFLTQLPLVTEQLLNPIPEWPHEVLSHQPEVCVEVEMGACVALRDEVGSEEGPVVWVELLNSWIDSYGPEILVFFFTWKSLSIKYVVVVV
ncbi:hypothetical protein INR49_014029 [Caranx melampygus]|nr:hypothetical protein INR49_014029 [Caranx melampygus]